MCFPAAMVVLTRTPSVEVGFLKEPNLHCQFAVDHKLPNVTVEWRLQRHGERSKLFSYFSRTGKSEGHGVAVKAIAAGNASFKLPPTRKLSEGTYICSVMVPPLYGSHDIPLTLSGEIKFNSVHNYLYSTFYNIFCFKAALEKMCFVSIIMFAFQCFKCFKYLCVFGIYYHFNVLFFSFKLLRTTPCVSECGPHLVYNTWYGPEANMRCRGVLSSGCKH